MNGDDSHEKDGLNVLSITCCGRWCSRRRLNWSFVISIGLSGLNLRDVVSVIFSTTMCICRCLGFLGGPRSMSESMSRFHRYYRRRYISRTAVAVVDATVMADGCSWDSGRWFRLMVICFKLSLMVLISLNFDGLKVWEEAILSIKIHR